MAYKSNQPVVPLWPALLVGFAGLAWLLQSMNWLPTSLPLGPLSIIIVALALVFYAYHRH